MTRAGVCACLAFLTIPAAAAQGSREDVWLLKPARIFDGESGNAHDGWVVRVRGERIDAVGPPTEVTATGARAIDMPGTTLMPGLIEAHSHVLLHAYSETSWNDQNAASRWPSAWPAQPITFAAR